MSTYTENYNLTLPEQDEYYDVAVFNENFDALDSIVGAVETATEAVNNKLGEPAADGTTIFSLLENSGGTSIKSIQKAVISTTPSSNPNTATINPVDPSRCLVIMERLYDTENSGCSKAEYTLYDTYISLDNVTAGYRIIGFWIIEFN